jgi:hypothetical protein
VEAQRRNKMAIKDFTTVDEVIEYLNLLLELDRNAITNIIHSHVSCNRDLAYHPSVQVLEKDGKYIVGFLGILNGLFGTFDNGFGQIICVLDEDTNDVLYFEKNDNKYE